MTPLEKNNLRKLLIAGWSLLKSEHLTEALEHIDEIVDVCDQFDTKGGEEDDTELSSGRRSKRSSRRV